MVRLVKGAYWDSEIKRAQVDGLEGFPVFTRKHPHRRLLPRLRAQAAGRARRGLPAVRDPQRADARHHPRHGRREFLCRPVRVPVPARHGRAALRGGRRAGDKLDRPCRIYAPVGTHETLLAYLVRRLLENGANTSFVNQIADPDVTLDDAAGRSGRARPRAGAGRRAASAHRPAARPVRRGAEEFARARSRQRAGAGGAGGDPAGGRDAGGRAVLADGPGEGSARAGDESRRPSRRRRHGDRGDAGAGRCRLRARQALAGAAGGARGDPAPGRRPDGSAAGAAARARSCARPARPSPTPSARCARRSTSCATTRAQSTAFRNDTHRPLGVVACISPWNFPLSIFTGQIAGALAAGNAVIAKPAEETPLIAAQAVALLHEAGVPREALQLLPGDGDGRRAAGRQSSGRGRGVHRLDRGGALDQQAARPAPVRRRTAADPDRRDRRAERDDRRFLGAARAGRARRADLGVRFGRPALLGAARALPAGRHRRPRPADAERRDGRARRSAIPIACRPMSVR